MATHHDAFDFLGCERVFAAQFEGAINNRMDHDSARIRLICILHDFPGITKTVEECRPVRNLTHRVNESLASFDWLIGAFETFFGEQSRPHSISRGISDADAFRWVAEALNQSGGLGSGVAKSPDDVRGTKLE